MPQRRRRKKANNPKNQTALRGGFSYPVQNPTKNTVAPEQNHVPRTHSAILRRPLTIRKNHHVPKPRRTHPKIAPPLRAPTLYPRRHAHPRRLAHPSLPSPLPKQTPSPSSNKTSLPNTAPTTRKQPNLTTLPYCKKSPRTTANCSTWWTD